MAERATARHAPRRARVWVLAIAGAYSSRVLRSWWVRRRWTKLGPIACNDPFVCALTTARPRSFLLAVVSRRRRVPEAAILEVALFVGEQGACRSGYAAFRRPSVSA